jgi:hypothetical protein
MKYDYASGKINEQQQFKKNDMSVLYLEIYKKKIESLNGKFDSIRNDGLVSDDIKNSSIV